MRMVSVLLAILFVVPACAGIESLLGSGPRPSASLRGVTFGD